MSIQLNVEEQELLAETVKLAHQGPTRREWHAQMLGTVAFLVASLSLVAIHPPHAFSIWGAIACIGLLTVAAMIRIDTPLGFTVATQLAFVPMLFVVPVTLVPLGVMTGLLLTRTIDIALGRSDVRRLHVAINNSFFALGPVLVFVIANQDPMHASAGLLLLALFAQFALDFGASSIEYRLARGIGLRAQFQDAWIYGVDAALSPIALFVAHEARHTPLAVLAPVPLLALVALLALERHHRLKSVLELNDAYRGTALVLGEVVEADDGYTATHCREVVRIALEVGAAVGLDGEEMRNLDFAALLHDVGKIAIPKEILNKPARLTAEEYEIVKTHTVIGQRMLDRVGGFMCNVGVIVRAHHERWDGNGYPDGLRGEEIPLAARIIACCDTWNAMLTDRVYRKALPIHVAIAEIRANAGSQLDPNVVEAFLEVVASGDHLSGATIETPAPAVAPEPSEPPAPLAPPETPEISTAALDREQLVAEIAAIDPVDRLLEESWESRSERATKRELIVEVFAGGIFLALAGVLAIAAFRTHSVDVGLTVLLVFLYALIAATVRFPVGAGYLVPTYLMLVPMLLLLPPGAVPILSALGLLLAALSRWSMKKAPLEHAIFAVPNAWYSLGPALVLMVGGHTKGFALAGIYVAALIAGCFLDLGISTLRESVAGSVAPKLQLRVILNVWAVDACIAPIGLAFGFLGHHHHAAILLVLPLILLLLLVQHDRMSRIEQAHHRLHLVAHERTRLQAAVGWLGEAFAAKLNLEELTNIVLRSSIDALDASAGVIVVQRGTGEEVRSVAGDTDGIAPLSAAVAAAMQARAVQRRSDGDYYALAIPLNLGSRYRGMTGALSVARPVREFERDEQALLERLAKQAREAIEEILGHETLRELAMTDALTGLGNRRKLLTDLQALLHNPYPLSTSPLVLLLFDLDGFKTFNDTFGHPAGDALLVRLAQKLGQAVDDSGTAYRLGGDEFCAVVDASGEQLHVLLDRAADALCESGQEFNVRASCGAALIPHEADTPEQALKLADERLYAHKQRSPSGARSQTRDLLMGIMEAHEPELQEHGSRVSALAAAVASRLGVVGEARDELLRAAELHDVGKVAVSDAVVAGAGKLEPGGLASSEQFTVLGEHILNSAPALRSIAKVVRATRECWDGQGFPDGLAGEEIPLAARIVAVCDVYDTILAGGPFGGVSPEEAARQELLREAGRRFDPGIVTALLDELDEVPPGETLGLVVAEPAIEGRPRQLTDELLQLLDGMH